MLEQPQDYVAPLGRVYVTNRGYHDYSSAAKYGEFVFLTEARIDYRHTDRIRAQLIEQLKDFDPEKDYVLISGMPPLAFEVAYHLARRFGKVRYLYWEPLMNDYLPRETSGEMYV